MPYNKNLPTSLVRVLCSKPKAHLKKKKNLLENGLLCQHNLPRPNHVMNSRLKNFLKTKNFLSDSQYGFREQYSTQYALLDIVNTIQSNIDNKFFSCGIFIDLKKAFDTVDHDILLYKLKYYGIRGVVNDWFSSYLKNRLQTTLVGNCVSDKKETLCGVPQGSVLGPFLFLIYINNICESSRVFKFFLFADDTNLLYTNKN